MTSDKYGNIILNEKEIFDVLYSVNQDNIFNTYVDKDIADKFNQSKNINKDSFINLKEYIQPNISLEEFDRLNQENWFMPKNYCPDLINLLYSKCTTEDQKNRVTEELELFAKHKMLNILYYLKYLIDLMRKHNIVWGVGRGSSVASYVLFLLGVHKIDSIKHDLDIKEFLK